MLSRSVFLRSTSGALLLPLFGSLPAGAATAEMAMTVTNGLITLPLGIKGIEKPVTALLNTGFDLSLIDTKRWKALGGRDIAHPAGKMSASTDALTLGTTPLVTTKLVLVDDLNADVANLGVAADVLLGFGAFAGSIVTLDFAKNTIALSASGDAPQNSVPITFEQYQPHSPKLITLDGFAVDGVPIAVQFDSMWTGNMILFPQKFPTAPPIWPLADVPKRKYEDGELTGRTVGKITFGGASLGGNTLVYVPTGAANVPTTRLAGVVGTGLVSNRSVILDFLNNRFAIS